MNYAVISSDTNLTYAFYLPITSLLWKLRGRTPLVILTGHAGLWLHTSPRTKLILEQLQEIGAKIYFVSIPFVANSDTVAQCARLFAADLPGINADDHLITSDADMFVFGDWVGGNRDESKDLQLYFSNAYSGGACPHGEDVNPCPHFPINYIGAKAKTWREIVQGSDLTSMLKEIPKPPIFDFTEAAAKTQSWKEALDAGQPARDEYQKAVWSHDERWIGSRIRAWSGFPDRTQQIPRTFAPGEWRVDRSDWHVGDPAWCAENLPTLDGVADAHLPRWRDGLWPEIRPLLELALSPKWLAWTDTYHQAYAQSLFWPGHEPRS